MFNAIPGSTQYISEQNGPTSSRTLSLAYADIPDELVTSAVDAIISRTALAYLDLMGEAKAKPEIISDYKSSLYDYYKNQSLTPEINRDVLVAQQMAPDYNVITKTLPPKGKISVFSEKNMEFDENQALAKARAYIKLRVDAKEIEDEDPLDQLLSRLSKKIFSLGYGNEGTFDIRLEKGLVPLESNPWKWHYDGEGFKTSITVCYSNKGNWGTRVSDSTMNSPPGMPSDHGFLYDALKVYHRAPIPADLEGKELTADDYRLFIRYNEFYKNDERIIDNRNGAEKVKRSVKNFSENSFEGIGAAGGKIPPLFPDFNPIPKISDSEFLRGKMSSFTIPPSNTWVSQKAKLPSKLMENIFDIDFTSRPPIVPEYNFSELLGELRTPEKTDFHRPVTPFQDQFDEIIETPKNTKDNVLPITSETEHAQQQEENKPSQCIVM
jgi:hypothetical protein